MCDISTANKTIAKTIATAFGGSPRVIRFWDDAHESFVDILSCANRPQEGVTSFSTIGTSDFPLYKDCKEYPVRVELVGVCGSNFKGLDRALASAAFCIINSRWFCFPGAIFPNVLTMYECSGTMRHLFFMPPFLWESKLHTIDLVNKKVAWLLAVPISDEERAYCDSHGSAKLEELFKLHQIDIFNLDRPSVI